jgi:hypothetical protein
MTGFHRVCLNLKGGTEYNTPKKMPAKTQKTTAREAVNAPNTESTHSPSATGNPSPPSLLVNSALEG